MASLKGELEAILLYQEGIKIAGGYTLKDILVHNRGEEKEHAQMLIAWLMGYEGGRTNSPSTDLRKYGITIKNKWVLTNNRAFGELLRGLQKEGYLQMYRIGLVR